MDHVGIEDDFFHLGGHSILAIQLVHQIQRACKVHVAVADIFKYKTIAQLATQLEGSKNVIIHKTTLKQVPLSFAQERLWFIEQYEQGSNAYHIPMVYQLTPTANKEALKQTLHALVKRHEVLHTVFKTNKDNQYYQSVLEALAVIKEKSFTNKNQLEKVDRFFNRELISE